MQNFSTTTVVTVTYTQPGVETQTPPGDMKTIQTTSSIYVPSYTNIAVTEGSIATVEVSDSSNLHDFNSHGLWGVTISIIIVTTTLVFMVIT
jgi:hypothetical protein